MMIFLSKKKQYLNGPLNHKASGSQVPIMVVRTAGSGAPAHALRQIQQTGRVSYEAVKARQSSSLFLLMQRLK